MRLSHVCLGCGMDLARVRAQFDAPTRLLVAVCPRCGNAAARRDFASVRRGRRRARASWSALLRQLFFAAALIGFTVGWCYFVGGAETSIRRGVFAVLHPAELANRSDDELIALGGWGLLFLSLGFWSAATLDHVRPGVRWGAIVGAVAALSSADWLVIHARNAAASLVSAAPWPAPGAVEMQHRGAGLLIAIGVAMLGALIGSRRRAGRPDRSAERWMHRLRRARRSRAHA